MPGAESRQPNDLNEGGIANPIACATLTLAMSWSLVCLKNWNVAWARARKNANNLIRENTKCIN